MTSPLMLLGALTPPEPAAAPLPADDPALFAAALAAALALAPKEAIAQVQTVTLVAPPSTDAAPSEGNSADAESGEVTSSATSTIDPPATGRLLGESVEPALPQRAAPIGPTGLRTAVPRTPIPAAPTDTTRSKTTAAVPRTIPVEVKAALGVVGPQEKGSAAALAGQIRQMPSSAPAPSGDASSVALAQPLHGKATPNATGEDSVTVLKPALPPSAPSIGVVDTVESPTERSSAPIADQPEELAPAPSVAPGAEAPLPMAQVPATRSTAEPVESNRTIHRRAATEQGTDPMSIVATPSSRVVPLQVAVQPVASNAVPAVPNRSQPAVMDAATPSDGAPPTDSPAPVTDRQATTLTGQSRETTPLARPTTRPARPSRKGESDTRQTGSAEPLVRSATPASSPAMPLPVTPQLDVIPAGAERESDAEAPTQMPARTPTPTNPAATPRATSLVRPLAAAFAQIVAELLADAPIREIRVQSVQAGSEQPISDGPDTVAVDPALASPDAPVTPTRLEATTVGIPARASSADSVTLESTPNPIPAPTRDIATRAETPASPLREGPVPMVAADAAPMERAQPKVSAAPVGLPDNQTAAVDQATARAPAQTPARRGVAAPPHAPLTPPESGTTRANGPQQDIELLIPDRPRAGTAAAVAAGDAARTRRGESRIPSPSTPAPAAESTPTIAHGPRSRPESLVAAVPARLELPESLAPRAAETKLPADRQELPPPAVDLAGSTREGPEATPRPSERATDDTRSASEPPASLTAAPTREGERPAEAPRAEARNLPERGLSEERPAVHSDRVTLQVIDQEGRSTRIRVAVLGQQIRAVIVPQDGEGGRHLEQRMDELHAALARQGFVDSRVTVQASGTEQAISWASPAGNTPVAPGSSRGTDQQPGEQRQGSGRREQGRQEGGQRHPQGRSRDREQDSRRR